mgnify:FL=1
MSLSLIQRNINQLLSLNLTTSASSNLTTKNSQKNTLDGEQTKSAVWSNFFGKSKRVMAKPWRKEMEDWEPQNLSVEEDSSEEPDNLIDSKLKLNGSYSPEKPRTTGIMNQKASKSTLLVLKEPWTWSLAKPQLKITSVSSPIISFDLNQNSICIYKLWNWFAL